MLKQSFVLVSAVTLCAAALHAGETTVSSGKSFKQTEAPPVVEEECFKAGEWQVDLFGQYSDGKAGRVGLFREHGWGGGVGLNYFFSRQIGLGFDAAWLGAREDSVFESNGANETNRTTLHNFSGSVIVRFPINQSCLAPYIYAGGGFHVDGEQWASGHGGVGLEYRIKPNRLGIFVDGRWTYLGDRGGRDDLNFISARVGVRVVF